MSTSNVDVRKGAITKLLRELAKQGIKFKESDELGRNVVFYNESFEKKISFDWFYRHSGICSYRVIISEREFTLKPMDDEMFYTSFLKAILLYSFDPKNRANDNNL